MNFFAYPTAAERYAKGRPFFHPLAVEKIRAVCRPNGHVKQALDVGCGTGSSTRALLEIADEIVGLDSSSEMLSRALRDPGIRYVEGNAEAMPFDDSTFSLATVALAFHWSDQPKFLAEAHRVLQPGGWLVIYNDWFNGQMKGNDKYEKWYRDRYIARFPSTVRNTDVPTDVFARESGFVLSGSDQFAHDVEFTSGQLVNYLLTQSNAIAAVERGGESLQAVGDWLLDSVQPLFSNPVETFPFVCQIRFLQR